MLERGARGTAARRADRGQGHVRAALARAARRRASATCRASEPGESAVYRRLRDAGAVIVARHQHARVRGGLDRPHLGLRAVRNPGTPSRCGGGSSGGSAAAVGARLVAGAVGTDGGGSIRYPAAYCGVTGLKFTWGLVPSDGYTHGLLVDGRPGPMCRDAADARLLAEALLGRPLEARRARNACGSASCPRFWEDIDPEVAEPVPGGRRAAARERHDRHGGRARRHRARAHRDGAAAAARGRPRPCSPRSGRDPSRALAGRPGAAKYRFLIPAAALVRAELVRAQLRRSLAARSSTSTCSPGRRAGARAADRGPDRGAAVGPRAGRLRERAPGRDREPRRRARAVGARAASRAPGCPVGLQLLAPWREDERLLDVAELLEQATDRRHVDAVPPMAQKTPAYAVAPGFPLRKSRFTCSGR